MRQKGLLESVKAIGWFIDEYGIAQISMNLTDINITSLHKAFETVRECANKRGLRVTGSELVGLVPKKVLLDAGKYFLEQQQRSLGVSEAEIMKIAVKSLGLDELSDFDPSKKVIEYMLEDSADKALVNMKLNSFADLTASESPAPGGGSISAYVGSLGVALGAMVANLSSHKKGWDDKWEFYSKYAENAQAIKDELLFLVDEDTQAFNKILEAIRMPKSNDAEKQTRIEALNAATRYAIDVPLNVMKTCLRSYEVLEAMSVDGLKASISDAGVGALCTHAAIEGAFLNVKINCKDFDDAAFVEDRSREAQSILEESAGLRNKIMDNIHAALA